MSRPSEIACISLHQPWASLIFMPGPFGGMIKKHETRHWPIPSTLQGETVAIHAAAQRPRPIDPQLRRMMPATYFLPFGVILGTVRLGTCWRTDDVSPDDGDALAGDFGSGRYAWELHDAALLPQPYPTPGKQSIWYLPRRTIGI